LSGQLKTN